MSEPRDSLSVEALGAGRYLVRSGTSTSLAFGVASAEGVWVWLDGAATLVQPERAADGPSHATDALDLASPMPATVRHIAVSPGQHVEAGDTLVVLEAMKMELAITAPRAGTVRAVHCAVGALAQPGVALVEVE